MANPVLTAQARDLEWHAVSSTNVKAVAYADGVGRVFNTFLDGRLYCTGPGVPESEFASLLSAPSKGRAIKTLHASYGYVPLGYA